MAWDVDWFERFIDDLIQPRHRVVPQEIGGSRSFRQIERYAHPSETSKQAAVGLLGGTEKVAHAI